MAKENANNASMSKEEMIGYHKGSINTLLAERNELLKMAGITENLINAHAQELHKLGVNIAQQNPPQQNALTSENIESKKTKKA